MMKARLKSIDRDGSFEPQLIKKHQTRITGMDEQIIALYAKGLVISTNPCLLLWA
jgi:putative transposase